MPIELTCSCGKRLKVADAFAGRQGQCPACGGLLHIPEREAAAPPSSHESAPGVIVDCGLDELLAGRSA